MGRRQLLLLDCFFILLLLLFFKAFFKSRSVPSEGGLTWETTQGRDLRRQVARFCFPATEERGKLAPGRSGVRVLLSGCKRLGESKEDPKQPRAPTAFSCAPSPNHPPFSTSGLSDPACPELQASRGWLWATSSSTLSTARNWGSRGGNSFWELSRRS